MMVRRRQVDLSEFDRLTVTCIAHRELRTATENVGQVTGRFRRDMDNDKNRCRKVGRQIFQNLPDHGYSAGGTTDHNDVARGLQSVSHFLKREVLFFSQSVFAT